MDLESNAPRRAFVSSICKWFLVSLVLFSTSECCDSHQEEPLLYHPLLPQVHPGVERDFEYLLSGKEEKVEVRSHAVDHDNLYPDRMLQDSLELAFCYDALYLADENKDNKVDRDEFVTFAQIMGPPGFLPDSESYTDLPLILQSNFIILACLCLQLPNFDGGNRVNPQCCAVDPHIDVNGTQPGQVPTSQQSQYLYQVCFLTETSIERLLLSETPTPEPSKPPSPIITNNPTKNPTAKPSHKPTKKPTKTPTELPTSEPTQRPSLEPTKRPSLEPTKSPSEGPTKAISADPTVTPTDVPTIKPSASPSAKPTSAPTDAPTIVVTESPTGMPTVTSSEFPTQPPSVEMTENPTETPTFEDSETPTDSPTIVTTDSPTETPTVEDSERPTDTPTLMTTESPTEKPTIEASETPTGSPTITVSDDPTMMTTVTPTMKPTPFFNFPTMKPTVEDINVTSMPISEPTIAPTFESAVEIAFVEYGIAITNGKIENIPYAAYETDLIESMNIVAEDVALSIDVDERRLSSRYQEGSVSPPSLRKRSRKLANIVSVKLPTRIDDVLPTDCAWFVPSNNECKDVSASIELSIAVDATLGRQDTPEGISDTSAVKDLFEKNLNAAIEAGALQAALIEVNPNSVVSITTGAAPPTFSPTGGPTESPTIAPIPISPGGIVGIILAGVGGLIIGFIVICALRRRGVEANEANSVVVDDTPADDFGEDLEGIGSPLPAEVTSIDPFPERDKIEKYDEPLQSPDIVDMGPPVVDTGSPARIGAVAAVGTAITLAATTDDHESSPSPGKKKKAQSNLYAVPGAKPAIGDDASSAGESGWSSNQDGSSANTSIDASLDSIPQTNFTGMAPIVLGDVDETGITNEFVDDRSSMPESPERSNLSVEQEQANYTSTEVDRGSPQSTGRSQENSYTGTTGTDGSAQSTYSELDEAIQKGDWAAVGVTAALLASQAYGDDSTYGSSKQTPAKLKRQNPPLNPERAAELDRLVESGDWEGVVAAAAKFDAQEALRCDAQSSQQSAGSVVSSGGGSHNSSAMSGSVGGSSTGTAPSNISESQTIDTTTSPSTYTATGLTATSDTASAKSKARKLNEIRDEVEALVNAVVPEEADNVDEMMTQFKGREEELVETLRSMQERQVAQKARKESQKQAKRQAKEYVQDKKKQESLEALENIADTEDDLWMKEIDNTEAVDMPSIPQDSIEEQVSGEASVMKSQLKEAIDKEDWQNVADAAAGLSGHPPSREDATDGESVSSDRTKDINTLVDEGDWDGVVAAASKYAEGSTTASNNDFTAVDTEEDVGDDSTIEERRKRREERLKEEEEALAQAQIWDAIADQTKVDNPSEDGAAGLAADWAIDQSLAALQKAEEDDDNKSQDSSNDKKGDNESF